jgi:hypothetical protein
MILFKFYHISNMLVQKLMLMIHFIFLINYINNLKILILDNIQKQSNKLLEKNKKNKLKI